MSNGHITVGWQWGGKVRVGVGTCRRRCKGEGPWCTVGLGLWAFLLGFCGRFCTARTQHPIVS